MQFKLGAFGIYEIGEFLSNKLAEENVSGKAELTIFLNENEFKVLDEDLFYRMRTNENDEFVPSEGEIIVNFDKTKIKIKNADV